MTDKSIVRTSKRYTYEDYAIALHLAKCRSTYSPDEIVLIDAGRWRELPMSKLKRVNVKRRIMVDRSKYSCEALRQIRARNGVGRPPKRDLEVA